MSSEIPQICPYCKEDLANAWHDDVGVNVVYDCGTYQIKHPNAGDFTDSHLCSMGVIALQAKIDFLIEHCQPVYAHPEKARVSGVLIDDEKDLDQAMILHEQHERERHES